jgi:transcriptional regulator with XRE-family HTH domain
VEPDLTLCSVYYTLHIKMSEFGRYIRMRREDLRESDRSFSVRQVAARVGVEPSYLSKVERGHEAPPSEAKIRSLARELGEDPDTLLAMAGKVASDLQEVIRRRPRLMSQLIREVQSVSDDRLHRLVTAARQKRT